MELFNDINGSNYTNPDAIEITTIREIMYLGMRNDVSFLITIEGIVKGFAGLIRKGLLSLKDAALEANMTEAEFTSQMAALNV